MAQYNPAPDNFNSLISPKEKERLQIAIAGIAQWIDDEHQRALTLSVFYNLTTMNNYSITSHITLLTDALKHNPAIEGFIDRENSDDERRLIACWMIENWTYEYSRGLDFHIDSRNISRTSGNNYNDQLVRFPVPAEETTEDFIEVESEYAKEVSRHIHALVNAVWNRSDLHFDSQFAAVKNVKSLREELLGLEQVESEGEFFERVGQLLFILRDIAKESPSWVVNKIVPILENPAVAAVLGAIVTVLLMKALDV